QSNISSRIQNLEKKFATKLFYRNKEGMILTSNGEVLKDYANKILSVSEEMEQVLNQKDNQRGKLDIASVETVIKLPLILSKFNKEFRSEERSVETEINT